jgi:3-deoxy-D-manno-octulosonic-acid transferase
LGRLFERFGITFEAKPSQPLIWLHAASVGESSIALNLVENLSQLNLNLSFLITSGTLSSSEIIKSKLPPKTVHQFLPVDNIIFVKKFLKNWQPKLGIFIEAEIWPCLITEASKVCKLLLLNAHISDRSFRRWNFMKPFFQKIMLSFSEVMTQSNQDYNKYNILGVNNLNNIGNIKFANKKLPVCKEKLAILPVFLRNQKVIVFASTHESDEQVILNIIKPIKKLYKDCYFILVLRHPNRCNEVAKRCANLNLTYSARSHNVEPNIKDDIYIVDTLGELGLFYSIAYISFVGGSFTRGGHNPIEPAHFGNLICFGPNMKNCYEIAKEMVDIKAAIQINDGCELQNLLQHFLSDIGILEAKAYSENAQIFVTQHQQIFKNYLTIVAKYVKCLN